MGRRGIPIPDERELPPGAHRDLVLAVHELYREAGWPSTRRIADGLSDGDYPGTMNHEMVSQFLRGRTLCTLLPVQSLAMYFAQHSASRAPATEGTRAFGLWQSAMAADRPSTAAPHAIPQQRLRDDANTGTNFEPSQTSQTEPPAAAETPLTQLPSPSPEPPTPSGIRSLLARDIAELADARTAHGGRSIADVEGLSQRITDALNVLFADQLKEAGLPPSLTRCSLGCTFGDLPYRVAPGNNALKIQVVIHRPSMRIELTPIVGIARDRHAEHTYVLFDANVHGGDALYLTLDEVDGQDLTVPGGTIDRWIERKLHEKLTDVIQVTRRNVRGEV